MSLKLPVVNVPVLSKTKVLVFANFSKETDPLIKIPFLEPTPIPAKKAIGTEMTKAQGQEIKRIDNALNRLVLPPASHDQLDKPKPIKKARRAITITVGV